MTPDRKRARGLAMIAAKALVSAALIFFALRGVDAANVLHYLRSATPLSLAVAVLVTTAISLLHARRWEIVLSRMAHAVPFGEALRLVLIGYFFNQTLPSIVGGDAYRAWGAYRLGIRASAAVASVVVDRVFALATLVLMIAGGLAWLFDLVTAASARWMLALIIVGGAAGMVALVSLARFGERLRQWHVTRFALQVSEGVRAVARSSGATAQVIALTLTGFVAASYTLYVLAQGLGVGVSLGYALLFVPLVTLVTVVPISIGGWGLRESSMVVALGLIGVPAVQAFSLSVLYGLVVMASGLPGGLLWLGRRRRAAEPGGVQSSFGPPR